MVFMGSGGDYLHHGRLIEKFNHSGLKLMEYLYNFRLGDRSYAKSPPSRCTRNSPYPFWGLDRLSLCFTFASLLLLVPAQYSGRRISLGWCA